MAVTPNSKRYTNACSKLEIRTCISTTNKNRAEYSTHSATPSTKKEVTDLFLRSGIANKHVKLLHTVCLPFASLFFAIFAFLASVLFFSAFWSFCVECGDRTYVRASLLVAELVVPKDLKRFGAKFIFDPLGLLLHDFEIGVRSAARFRLNLLASSREGNESRYAVIASKAATQLTIFIYTKRFRKYSPVYRSIFISLTHRHRKIIDGFILLSTFCFYRLNQIHIILFMTGIFRGRFVNTPGIESSIVQRNGAGYGHPEKWFILPSPQ